MKFSLDIFENQIEEELLLSAESLFDKDPMINYSDPTKNLITILLEDQGYRFEVELLRKGKFIEKYTCDCSAFSSSKICKHVIACIFQIRKWVSNESEKKKQVERKSKFNMGQFLSTIEREDLNRFLKSYASKDRRFALALRAKFARNIESIPKKKSYKSILDSIIRPVSTTQKKVSPSNRKLFLDVLNEFHAQAVDYLSLGQYPESIKLVETCINKIFYVQKYMLTNDPSIDQARVRFYELIEYILALKDIPPDLLSSFHAFLLELIQKSYYFERNIKHSIIELLSLPNTEIDLVTELLPVLKQRLKQKDLDKKTANYLVAKIISINGLDILDTSIPSIDSDKIIRIFNQLLVLKSWTYAKDIIDFGRSNRILSNRLYAEANINLLRLKEDFTGLFQYSLEQFSVNKEFKFFELAYQYGENVWSEHWPPIESELIREGLEKNKTILLRCYERMNNATNIFDLLEKDPDYKVFPLYQEMLFNADKDRFLHLAKMVIHQNIKNYGGEDSIRLVDNILRFLHLQQAYQSMNQLKTFIKSEFPHRNSIIKGFS